MNLIIKHCNHMNITSYWFKQRYASYQFSRVYVSIGAKIRCGVKALQKKVHACLDPSSAGEVLHFPTSDSTQSTHKLQFRRRWIQLCLEARAP